MISKSDFIEIIKGDVRTHVRTYIWDQNINGSMFVRIKEYIRTPLNNGIKNILINLRTYDRK